MAFVAGVGWRKQGWDENNPVSGMLAKFWIILQPILFGLIGTEIRVSFWVNCISTLGSRYRYSTENETPTPLIHYPY